ncbi:uncharacterized protein LOC100708394 isoform X1 [Oreochromis niloticus]|uniref:uncharacterized protein LOC100708394 isoform X1 n=1 Tax=Oreochromis niloticus TaxID=8128 RepID=UPI000DF46B22|nr:uncharacterized protein LOC100708394 isoform X1 [Oreochromis niloticus]
MEEDSDPEPILPASCVFGAVTWEIESQIREAQDTEPNPGTGPPGRLYVPTSVRSHVLQWGHTARFSCHPGIRRTISFLQRYFWWPTLIKDTREYVTACSTCAQNKHPNQPPSGLLQPLPTPGWPWSHISLDFVTGLPPSSGNTVILTIVDRFSKAAHFVALPKLPTALEHSTAYCKCLDCTASLTISSLTEDLSLPRVFGKNSAQPWAQRLVFHLVFTLRPTDRRSVPTRSWKPPSAALSLTIKLPGATSYHGLNMLITALPCPPRDYLRSKLLWDTNCHCFLQLKVSTRSPLFNTTSAGAVEPGVLLEQPCFGQRSEIRSSLITVGPPPLNMQRVKRYGCLLASCLFEQSLRNSHPPSLDLLKLTLLSTQYLFA